MSHFNIRQMHFLKKEMVLTTLSFPWQNTKYHIKLEKTEHFKGYIKQNKNIFFNWKLQANTQTKILNDYIIPGTQTTLLAGVAKFKSHQ